MSPVGRARAAEKNVEMARRRGRDLRLRKSIVAMGGALRIEDGRDVGGIRELWVGVDWSESFEERFWD